MTHFAEKYFYNSPYEFSENKVTSHVELEGLEAENFMSKLKDPGVLKERRPSENAQQQRYSVTVTDSKKSFSDMKSSFLEAPQKLLTNGKAEFCAPVGGEGNPTEFKEGSFIKIDITGPVNKGQITFTISTDENGNHNFSINS